MEVKDSPPGGNGPAPASMLRQFLADLGFGIRHLSSILLNRLYISRTLEKDIVGQFHRLYFDAHVFNKTWGSTFWLGVQTLKCPLDLWIYQEIVVELKPDVIVESGTAHGGSALFLASMCDLVGKGRVITIDTWHSPARPQHARITYLHGSSTSAEIVEQVRKLVDRQETVLVILDSAHDMANVSRELKIYSEFVTKGSYLIVEDTCVNGHPIAEDFGPGPMEAVNEFLPGATRFVIDKTREKLLLTFNPNGFLKRTN